jgi:hypothetical protein
LQVKKFTVFLLLPNVQEGAVCPTGTIQDEAPQSIPFFQCLWDNFLIFLGTRSWVNAH